MKIIIVHLSDIHVQNKSSADSIVARMRLVPDAVQNLESDVSGCIVLVTGDLAYSGSEVQYELLKPGLEAIKTGLERSMAVPVHVVVVPGNHDCVFSDSQTGRDLIANSETQSSASPVSDDAISICVAAQDEFFSFRREICPAEISSRLAWEELLQFGDEIVSVSCLNTAWISQLHEKQGQLKFPVSAVPAKNPNAAVAISIFHHPYNWLMSNNAREFRRCVEERSDFIFTGHEHDADQSIRFGRSGEKYMYIEGGAFSEHSGSENSSFNAVVVDTATASQRNWEFKWEGTLFRPKRVSPPVEEYIGNRLRTGRLFVVHHSFADELDDPGIVIEQGGRGAVRLRDIFVYPDLRFVERTISFSKPKPPRVMRGEDLAQFACEQKRVMISGTDRSGKTCLAKRLTTAMLERGYVPLFVDAAAIRLRGTELDQRELMRLYEDQYREPDTENYRQLSKSKRFLVVDNGEHIKGSAFENVLSQLARFSDNIVVFISDVAHSALEIAGAGRRPVAATFESLRIMPLGRVRRDELANKWFSRDAELLSDEANFARRLVAAQSMFDTFIGKNYLPSYPGFLLPALQAQDFGQPIDLSASSYGYFYELLIRRSLSPDSRAAFDVKLSFLSWLAFDMYEKKTSVFSDSEMRDVFARFEGTYEPNVVFGPFMDRMLQDKILVMDGLQYRFKYSYIYYYFVASYFRDRIAARTSDGDLVRSRVTELCGQLRLEEAANILLFLAHLSKDTFIIEQLLAASSRSFAASPAVDLADAPEFTRAEQVAIHHIYSEQPARVARQALLQRMDDQEGKQELSPQQELELETVLVELSTAFKTIQLLGQIVKNFPGSITKTDKERIVDACVGIGRRVLGFAFGLIGDKSEVGLRSLVDRLLAEEPHLSADEVALRARAMMNGMLYLMGYGIVRHLVVSTGSSQVQQTHQNLSSHSSVHALVNLSLKMSQSSTPFPVAETKELAVQLQDIRLGRSILGGLVVNHFQTFEEKVFLKQELCSALDIEYKSAAPSNPRLRLLKGR